jgi:hypothetical protein
LLRAVDDDVMTMHNQAEHETMNEQQRIEEGLRAMDEAVESIVRGERTLEEAVEVLVGQGRPDFPTWPKADQEACRAYFAMFLRLGVQKRSRDRAAQLTAAGPTELAVRHGFDQICAEAMGLPADEFEEN